jgi:diguanylate cyclase (GGDEF)-like protein/PAS domain S-box-containing protein
VTTENAPSIPASLVIPNYDTPLQLLHWLQQQFDHGLGTNQIWIEYSPQPLEMTALSVPDWLNEAKQAGQSWFWRLSDGNRLLLTLRENNEQTQQSAMMVMAFCATLLDMRLSDVDSPCRQELYRYQSMLDQIDSSIISMDLDGYITSWNRGAEHLFGYTKQEALGKHVLFLYAEEDEDNLLAETFMHGSSRDMLVQRKHRDGSTFWASITLSLLLDDHGQAAGLLGYVTDATARVKSEERLRLQAAIFEYSGEAILITDDESHLVSANRAFLKLFGYRSEDEVDLSIVLERHYDAQFWRELRTEAAREGYWLGEVRACKENTEPFPVWLSLSSVHNIDDCLTHFIYMFSDLSERKQTEAKLHRLAYFDMLTELPNRVMLSILLRQALEESRRSQAHGAVLFINIDRFKRINDVFGVSAGDEVLVCVGQRLRKLLRSEDVVARCGVDEFVIALFDLSRREHASIVARKVKTELDTPISLTARGDVAIQVSIGIALFPDDGEDPEILLRNASLALTRLRHDREQSETNYLFFSSDMNRRAQERHQIEEDLRQAIVDNQLKLYFQPQFDVTGQHMHAAEVLLRWPHPQRGMIPPNEFIAVAEETGLIHELGDWVLEQTCIAQAQWRERGFRIVRLAVNISARQFRPALLSHVNDLLTQYQLNSDLLELEITETLLLHDIESVIGLLQNFNRLGLRIALDDFGTGYSALAYLCRLPIDTLKIDRCFVKDLPGGTRESAIVTAILQLAINQGLEIVAEGVENQEQLDFLSQHGCSTIQGFLFAKPMPGEEFEKHLQLKAPTPS